MKKQTRVKKYEISDVSIANLLQEGFSMRIISGIPKGSRFQSLHYNPDNGIISIYMSNRKFDKVIEGEIAPLGERIEGIKS